MSFAVDEEWVLALSNGEVSVVLPGTFSGNGDENDNFIEPDIAVRFIPNPRAKSFATFVEEETDGWYATYEQSTASTISGFEAIQYADSQLLDGRFPGKVTFINLGVQQVLLVMIQRFGYEISQRHLDAEAKILLSLERE